MFFFNCAYISLPLHAPFVAICIMPSGGSNKQSEDPRIVELRELNARLITVISFLKNKQTPRSIESSIANAETYMHDHTPAFIVHDSGTFEGTRHLGSLLQMCDSLEVKSEMGKTDTLTECTALLERKVKLMRDLYHI